VWRRIRKLEEENIIILDCFSYPYSFSIVF